MRRKVAPLALLLTYLVLIGVGSTSSAFAKIADLMLLYVHLGFVALLSISILLERFRRHHSRKNEPLYRQWKRWMMDG